MEEDSFFCIPTRQESVQLMVVGDEVAIKSVVGWKKRRKLIGVIIIPEFTSLAEYIIFAYMHLRGEEKVLTQ